MPRTGIKRFQVNWECVPEPEIVRVENHPHFGEEGLEPITFAQARDLLIEWLSNRRDHFKKEIARARYMTAADVKRGECADLPSEASGDDRSASTVVTRGQT